MRRNFDLIVDSCCDLPPELLDREGVHLVHFPYVIDGEERLDDLWAESSMREFYEGMRKGSRPTTSQASASELGRAFERASENGFPTLYLSFTSGMSSHYGTAARILEDMLSERPGVDVRIVDTTLASTGEAALVFSALEMQELGATIDEVEAWAKESRSLVHVEFMVDDLEYLRRGGRISSIVSIAGSLLDVKPLISIDLEGKLSVVGTARGRKKALKALVNRFAENVDRNRPMMAFVGHADCERDMKRVEKMIREAGFDPLFVEQPIGPVIGSHVGPGMVSLCYWGEQPRA